MDMNRTTAGDEKNKAPRTCIQRDFKMFSLGDFYNLVGQSSEQPSLTGAGPASSRSLGLRTSGYSLQNFFFSSFFSWPSAFVGSPGSSFPKVVAFLAG